MRQDLSARLKKIGYILKSLKSTYSISGSLIKFNVQKSQNYSVTVSGSQSQGTIIDFQISFTPDSTSVQAHLTQHTMYYTFTLTDYNGNVSVDSNQVKHGGDIDSSGKIIAKSDISFPRNTFRTVKIDAYAVSSGLVGGSFNFSHQVTRTS